MGYDGSQETAGYMEEGQVPTFKLLKSEDGSLNEMTMDVVSAWTNNGHAVITLTGTTPLPEAVSLMMRIQIHLIQVLISHLRFHKICM